jgi:hypothetical protein
VKAAGARWGVRWDRRRLSACTMWATQRLRDTGLAAAHGASGSDGSRTTEQIKLIVKS